MDAFTKLTGVVAPIDRINIDTDQIIPAVHLKSIERKGFEDALFSSWRYNNDGSENPDFVLNKAPYRNANVLVAGPNFGCGSSREHAPWALLDQGITCVIAPSFADIFHNNCYKNGILPVRLPVDVCEQLAAQAGGANHVFTVDLETQTVTTPDGAVHTFDVDPGRKTNLLEGLDEIGASLISSDDISEFETRRRLMTPWLEPAN